MYSGATAISVERVYFYGWLDKGIEWDAAYYAKIRKCRFMLCSNSALGTGLAAGMYITAGANNVQIDGCLFSENDYALRILGGTAVSIRDCAFEANGNLYSAASLSAQIGLTNTHNLVFEGNYLEGNYTGDVYALMNLSSCRSPLIRGNYFCGESGSTKVSDRLLNLSNCINATIQGNQFVEWEDYAIVSNNNSFAGPLDNTFILNGSQLTAHNDIHDHVSITGGAYFGIPVPLTHNFASLADGAGETVQLTFDGAAAGDAFIVGAFGDLHDATVTAYYHSANTVEVRLQNESGGTLDLVSGTYYVHCIKKRT